MSSTATVQSVEAYSPDITVRQKTFSERVVRQTFSGWGARLGLVWVAIVALVGAFAPLLANSHPLALRTKDGHLELPFIRFLSAADYTLMLGTLAAAVVWFVLRKRDMLFRWGMMAACYLVLVIPMLRLAHPPETVIFETYRENEQAGKYAWVWRAPIPFSPSDRMRDVSNDRPYPWGPSRLHWWGTDQFGSDVLSRMIYACRVALTIGFVSAGIATVIGIIVGGTMGYFGGWIDMFGMRLVEIFSAIPTLYLLLMVVAFFGRDLYFIMTIIGMLSWVGIARFVRAEYLRARNLDFVHAARALGLPLWSIMFRHLLPTALAPVLVSVTFAVAGGIGVESSLSFLGLGVVDAPSWGALLNQALGSTGGFDWWLAIFPGGAIFLTVFSYNLIGEAMRDALDPKLKKRE